MSASREKKSRQELNASGYVDPKVTRAAEEKAKARRSNLIYSLIGIAFVAVAAVTIISNISNSPVIGRNAEAYTVNGETFTAADVNYYYRNAYNNFVQQNGSMVSYYFDTSKDLRDQESFMGDGSWFDYFADQATDTLGRVSALCRKAEAEGFDASEAQEAALESDYSYIDIYAAAQNMTREQYLQGYFGNTMTTEAFERNVRMSALAEAYSAAFEESLTYTDAEIKAAYDADPAAYQSADIEFISFTYTAETDATDEQKADLLAETKENAEAALERYNAGEALEAIAGDLGGSYHHMPYASRSTTSDLLTWAFDDARSAGDASVIPYGESGFYTAVFHSRFKNDYHPVSVRHILIDDEEIAKSILEQYKAGEQTEDAFALLAAQYTTDSGSAANGGLYENFGRGQMVESFENWAYDSARKAGDVEIVESDYGYHVMYFVGTADAEYWQIDAENDLHAADYNEWFSALTDGVEGETLKGMKFVG